MDRWGCVDAPALPLQLLIRRSPAWKQEPAAVVAEDAPLAEVLWINERAFQAGVRRGQRYAAALALCPGLCAGVVALPEIQAGVEELCVVLGRHAPGVEPSLGEPGIFWLDGDGLERLYVSPLAWGQALLAALQAIGVVAQVVIGGSRFGTYAVARATPIGKVVVLESAEQEARAAKQVPLARVGAPPRALTTLAQLGVRTVGELVRLPGAGLARRFGAEIAALHQQARLVVSAEASLLAEGEATPLTPFLPQAPLTARCDLDDPTSDVEQLTFLIKQLVDRLLVPLATRCQALQVLEIGLEFGKDAPPRQERLSPAAPTLDSVQLLGLVRLRLESMQLAAGARVVTVELHGTLATRAQLELFAARPRRDLEAGERALARLRAAYGDQAVGHAALGNGHLPEAQFAWGQARPVEGASAEPQLVRRLYASPLPLPPRPPREPDGWLLRGLDHGPVRRLVGPHVLSGGWWRREVQRDYYFAELADGELCWIFYDRVRRRWFLHGVVE